MKPLNRVDEKLIELLRDTLSEFRGNRMRTAEHLGIPLRTLRNWMVRYGLRAEFPKRHGQNYEYNPPIKKGER